VTALRKDQFIKTEKGKEPNFEGRVLTLFEHSGEQISLPVMTASEHVSSLKALRLSPGGGILGNIYQEG